MEWRNPWTFQSRSQMGVGAQDRKITYESTDKDGKPVKVTYDSSQLSSQSDQVKNEVEPSFVNDNYWALFPFHAYWDKSATVTDQAGQKLPIGVGSATLVSVKYPADG